MNRLRKDYTILVLVLVGVLTTASFVYTLVIADRFSEHTEAFTYYRVGMSTRYNALSLSDATQDKAIYDLNAARRLEFAGNFDSSDGSRYALFTVSTPWNTEEELFYKDGKAFAKTYTLDTLKVKYNTKTVEVDSVQFVWLTGDSLQVSIVIPNKWQYQICR